MISFSSLIIVFAPLIGSIILLLYPNKNNIKSSLIANISIGISFLFSLILLINYFFENDNTIIVHLFTWLSLNNFTFEFSFLVDSLTIIMSFIVTFISFFVHIYSVGYMRGDASFNRFLLYTNFFTFSMLLIIFMTISSTIHWLGISWIILIFAYWFLV